MQSLSPSSGISLKSLIRKTTPPPGQTHRFDPVRFVIQCGHRSDSANTSASTVNTNGAPTSYNFAGHVGSSRADWQSSCAILASKVVSQQQDTEKTGDITVVNGHKTLDLVPIDNLPKPLTITDLSPAPMHGAQMRVAYQGVPGAYSEAAAGKAYPNCEAIPCDQFEVAFQAVELWIADRAVLPVENSLGGSIHRNYDLLLRHRLHIVGEVQLPVHHCLLALPGVRKEYLTRVISHPQALAQCELTLTKLGINVSREAVDDTAGAAEYIAANNLRDTAAIASARAAELYGLQILAEGIQDDSSNVTRFVMLARDPIIPRTDRPFKTSIVFAHDKGTSVLFKVLSAFAFRNISLTKIESRPHRNRPIRLVDDANVGTAKHFEYMFYVDFEASMADVRAQNALAEVQEFTSFLRVLGSYPMDMTPWCPSREE
ncbi:arogenate dehydratase 1-like [Nicotiana tabacum]|uniref:Arogenate dehydratase n=2 Tax=Nicotiana TaxID=4085 RepID=A0A1S3Z5D8_TOBAC|nr:PREDICTED: arogenate dehydratase/prephenate dehydratase 6, chloroplastic-like [Nicotiana sylvestris]XP_016459564.1 PREDICTED: arogenate dehydratase/prephenate dehydratase 6, chloroplastic-like [Nicotiana tabacum]